MRKIQFLTILILVFLLSGCVSFFNNVIDEGFQNMEIDHFELVYDDDIEILVGTEELPNFKNYINRISVDGYSDTLKSFNVNSEDIDIDVVGEYEVIYSFTSLEEIVEYTITVYVVEELTETEGTE